MKQVSMAGWVLLACVALGTWATPALADGVVLSPNRLSQADRSALQTELIRARSAEPRVFKQVTHARTLAIRLDARRHGRYATITPHLKHLGRPALLPMLEMLAFDAPARGAMSQGAWLTLRVGLLEAVGSLRDPRAIPVLEGVLDAPMADVEVTRAAAEALGRIGTDRAAHKLIALARVPGPKQIPVIEGMEDCRRLAVARYLATSLEQRPSEQMALALVKSLASVGNAWAWASPVVAGEQEPTRALAARSLVHAFVRHDGPVREAAAKGVLLVNHTSTQSLVKQARARATTDDMVEQLDRLARRVASNPIR
jgi:HEAT repeat protein